MILKIAIAIVILFGLARVWIVAGKRADAHKRQLWIETLKKGDYCLHYGRKYEITNLYHDKNYIQLKSCHKPLCFRCVTFDEIYPINADE